MNLQQLMETEPQETELPINPNISEKDVIQIPDIAFYSRLLPNTDDVPPKIPNTSSTCGSVYQPLDLGTEIGDASDNKDFVKEFTNQHFVKIIKHQDGGAVRVFECGVCGKEFSHQYTLMRHIPTHTGERKFTCETCGKAFRQLSTLSQHRAIHSAARPHTCAQCNKTFNRVSTLISHKKTHSNVKPHQCHLCDKSFHQKGNLRNHIFTHTNTRPYKCDICEKGFNQMSNMMCHKLKAHQHFDVIPKYTCKLCGEEFLKRINLRQHEQSEHGVGEVETSNYTPSKIDYSNAIIVDPIKTEAMRNALETKKTPFALLRPLSGMPVLVRVLPAGSKQLLVPATADDLKKYGQISISSESEPEIHSAPGEENDKENKDPAKPAGSIVQIKVPVVATVIQRANNDGPNQGMNMSIISPGPADMMQNQEKTEDLNLVFSSSLKKNGNISVDANLKNTSAPGKVDSKETSVNKQIVPDAQFEFLDKDQKIMTEEVFNSNFDLHNQFTFDPQSAAVAVNEYPTEYSANKNINSTAQINFNNVVNNFVILNNPAIPENNFTMPDIQANMRTKVNQNLISLYPNMAAAGIKNTPNQLQNNLLPFSRNVTNFPNAFTQGYATNNQLTAINHLNMFPNMMSADNSEQFTYTTNNFGVNSRAISNFNLPANSALNDYKSSTAVTNRLNKSDAIDNFKTSSSNWEFSKNVFKTSENIPAVVQPVNNCTAGMNNFSAATASPPALDKNNEGKDFTKAGFENRLNMDDINSAMMAHFNNMCNGKFINKNATADQSNFVSIDKKKGEIGLEKATVDSSPKAKNTCLNENSFAVKKKPAKDMPLLAEFE